MSEKRDIVQHLKDDAAGMRRAATEQPEYYAVLGVYAMTCHEAADEIERLRRWKAEATETLARWDAVADTIEIGPNQLGLHKSDLVAIELHDLRAQRDGYFAASHEWRDEYRNLHTLVRKWADDAEGAIYNSYEEAVAALRKAVGR